MSVLTPTQYALVVGKGAIIVAKMGPQGITTSLSSLMSVLGSNLEAVFNQLHDFVGDSKFFEFNLRLLSKCFLSEIPRHATERHFTQRLPHS